MYLFHVFLSLTSSSKSAAVLVRSTLSVGMEVPFLSSLVRELRMSSTKGLEEEFERIISMVLMRLSCARKNSTSLARSCLSRERRVLTASISISFKIKIN